MINVEPTQYIGIKEDIERIYYESLENLKTLMPVCNEITIYDNTKQIGEITYIVKGNLKFISENMPVWIDSIGFACKNILEPKKDYKRFCERNCSI